MTVKILTFEKFQNSQIKYFLSFILLSSVIILLIDQPDLGQSILLIGSWIATVFISGVSLVFIFIFLSVFLLSLSSLLFFLPEKFGYIINRLLTFIDPSQGDKFQSTSALDAIKLGGLTGQGMGEGILKESVPEAHTDYVIAVISEEFGSLISILILIIFLYISFRIIKNCFNQENQFLKISLSGLAALVNFSDFYSRRSEHKFITNYRHDITFFKLWRLIIDWQCNFSWISFKLYEEQGIFI
jgi:cell division protein FtsW